MVAGNPTIIVRTRKRPKPLLWGMIVTVILAHFPVPLVHAHQSELSDAGMEPPGLVEHLRRHHVDGYVDCGTPHIHFVLPWQIDEDQNDGQRRIPSSLGLWGDVNPTLVDVRSTQDEPRSFSGGDGFAADPDCGLPVHWAPPITRVSWPDYLSESHLPSLITLLCVMRC